MKTVIVIPARYGSTRLPGKPLLQLAGKTMLQRVVEIAQQVAGTLPNITILVATDDNRVLTHAQALNIGCVMTGECNTGSERVLQAVEQLDFTPDFIVNLQGDAPLTPPEFVADLIAVAAENREVQAVTVAAKLTWSQLDQLRIHKQNSPFSGTTVITDYLQNGIWFSKNIIPAIRNEQELRHTEEFSPVQRHFGIYGYRYPLLQKYVTLPQTSYEKLEGLEQLRLLENGFELKVVSVVWPYPEIIAGIDTMEDARLAEQFIRNYDL